MWNISNAIGGYKETRTWNFVPYVGFGWARSFGNHAYNNEFAFTYGLLNNIRLGGLVDLNLEVKQMVVNQRFDGVVRGSKGEGMTTITAGLTFKLNRRGFSRPIVPVPVDLTPYNNKIASLEGGSGRCAGQCETSGRRTGSRKEQSENDACSGSRNRRPDHGYVLQYRQLHPVCERDHEPGLCSQIHEGLSGQEVQDRGLCRQRYRFCKNATST